MPNSNSLTLQRYLLRLQRHSHLPERALHALLGVTTTVTQIGTNRDLVIPGQTVETAALVIEGLLGRFDLMLDGRRQVTALHLPGDMCDLHSVIAPNAAWGLTAMSTTTVAQVPHRELRALSEAYPEIARAFWKDTVVDGSVLAKWVVNVGRKDAQTRLAHFLCEIGLRMETAELGTRTRFALSMTQAQIGDVLALSPVHVNRTVQTLRREKRMTLTQGLVEITDFEALAELGEFDPTYLMLADGGARLRDQSSLLAYGLGEADLRQGP